MARSGRKFPCDRVLKYVACGMDSGFFMTDAYMTGAEEAWTGREKTDGAYTGWLTGDDIPSRMRNGRVQVADTIQGAAQNYSVASAGFNFRQGTKFTGLARQFVQLLAGTGAKIPLHCQWGDTVGVYEITVPGQGEEPDTTEYWWLRIRTTGVFRQKVKFCGEVRAVIACNEEQVPKKPVLGYDDGAWEEIANAGAVAAFYSGSGPFAVCSSWAFNDDGSAARNVCKKYDDIPNHPLGGKVLHSYQYQITFADGTDGEGNPAPVFSGISSISDGEVWGAELDIPGFEGQNLHGNYWFPGQDDINSEYNEFTSISQWELYNPGLWEGKEIAPIYVWWESSIQDWIVCNWLSESATEDITNPSRPPKNACGVRMDQGNYNDKEYYPTGTGFTRREFRPIFEQSDASAELYEESFTSQVLEDQSFTVLGNAFNTIASYIEHVGEFCHFSNVRQTLTSPSFFRRTNGRIPFAERQAMHCVDVALTTFASRTREEGSGLVFHRLTDWTRYFSTDETPGDCPVPVQDRVVQNTSTDSCWAPGQSVLLSVDFYRGTYPVVTGTNTEDWLNIGNRKLGIGIPAQCSWIHLDTANTVLSSGYQLSCDGSDADICNIESGSGCLACETVETWNDSGGLYDRSWYWLGSGGPSGSDSGISHDVAYEIFGLDPNHMFPPGYLRDAFENGKILVYDMWETSVWPPTGRENAEWILEGTGHYLDMISSRYPTPRIAISHRRPVFVGLPWEC